MEPSATHIYLDQFPLNDQIFVEFHKEDMGLSSVEKHITIKFKYFFTFHLPLIISEDKIKNKSPNKCCQNMFLCSLA